MVDVGPVRLLDTRDVDEARHQISTSYCDHRLNVAAASRFHAVQTESRVGRVAVHRLRYGVGVTIDATPLSSSVLVTSPRRGHLTVLIAGTEQRLGPGDVIAIGPDDPFTLRWEEGCELRTAQLGLELLREAGDRSGWLPPRLAPRSVASTHDAIAWHRLLAFVEAQGACDLPGSSGSVVTERIEELVAATVLTQHTERVGPGGGGAAAPRQLLRAVEYVEAHAADPLTVGEIAAAAHLSVRALQAGLQRHLHTTPTELVRSARLARAHEELKRARVGDQTVAAIAHRTGFGSPSRFTRYYAARYGVLPSETLRLAGG